MTDFPSSVGPAENCQKPGFCAVPACPFCRRRHRPGPGRAGAVAPVESRDRGPAARRRQLPVPAPAAPPAPIVLAEPEPAPPIAPSDFKALVGGSQRLLDEAAGAATASPSRRRSDRYELTLRLEKGDTVEKMLADIDVPEADRKQIAREAHRAPQEEEARRRRRDRAPAAERARAARRAARAVAVGAAATRARVHHHAPRRRHVRRRREGLQGEPAHRARRSRAHGSLQQSGVKAGVPSRRWSSSSARSPTTSTSSAN